MCPSAHQAACAWLWCVAGVGEQLWAGWLAPRPEGRESCGKALGNVIYNQFAGEGPGLKRVPPEGAEVVPRL